MSFFEFLARCAGSQSVGNGATQTLVSLSAFSFHKLVIDTFDTRRSNVDDCMMGNACIARHQSKSGDIGFVLQRPTRDEAVIVVALGLVRQEILGSRQGDAEVWSECTGLNFTAR